MASQTAGHVSIIEVVGSLNMDLVTVTPRVPGPGETVSATSFSTGFGGKGANQAVAAARLLRRGPDAEPAAHTKVYMTGAVGDDQFGKDFLHHLEVLERIDVGGVVVKKGSKTGTSAIIVEESTGENRILFTKGANGELRSDDCKLRARNDGEKHLVVFQMEIPVATLASCIQDAKNLNKVIILNTAPAAPLPNEIFRGLHYLIMNESEAALLSGVPEAQLSSSLDDVAKVFFEKGVQTVIITLGSKGAYFNSVSRSSDEQHGKIVPGQKAAKVVDTTAAGDTFCGALAVHLAANGGDVAGAISFANRAAAAAVTKEGAQSSMPYSEEI